MKTILIIFFTIVSLPGVYSQNFEGTIKYSIEVEGPEANSFLANKPCTRMDMHFKDNNFIIHTYEGQFPVTRLYIADSSEMYILDMRNEVAYRRGKLDGQNQEITPPKAIPTGDSAMVMNIKCAEYKLIRNKEFVFYYVSDLYKIDPKLFAGKKDAQVNFLTKGLDGRIPLKTVRKTSAFTVTTKVENIYPRKLEVSQFRIPENYKIKPRDNRY